MVYKTLDGGLLHRVENKLKRYPDSFKTLQYQYWTEQIHVWENIVQVWI